MNKAKSLTIFFLLLALLAIMSNQTSASTLHMTGATPMTTIIPTPFGQPTQTIAPDPGGHTTTDKCAYMLSPKGRWIFVCTIYLPIISR